MANSQPLQGPELIDCARANAKKGLLTVAQQCGYGEDTKAVWNSLQQAGQNMGIELKSLDDLITEHDREKEIRSIEIAPESSSEL